jgi:serine protease Do
VNSAIYSPTGNSVGIGFAIPASVAKPITDRLMRGETIERGYIGVTIGDADPDTLGALGLSADTKGALVNTAEPGGPAAAAGLQFGDVIVSMNGEPVADSSDLTRRVGALQPGQTARLEYLRDGRRRTANLRLGVRPSASQRNRGEDAAPGSTDKPEAPAASTATVLGLNVTPLTDALREGIGAPANVDGLVVTGAGRGGDRRFRSGGVVIQRVGSAPVRTIAEFRAAVDAVRQAGRDSVLLMVWTPAGGSGPVVVELPDPE